jgi:hypothetical protein
VGAMVISESTTAGWERHSRPGSSGLPRGDSRATTRCYAPDKGIRQTCGAGTGGHKAARLFFRSQSGEARQLSCRATFAISAALSDSRHERAVKYIARASQQLILARRFGYRDRVVTRSGSAGLGLLKGNLRFRIPVC